MAAENVYGATSVTQAGGIANAVNGSTMSPDTLKARVKGVVRIGYDLSLISNLYLPDNFVAER